MKNQVQRYSISHAKRVLNPHKPKDIIPLKFKGILPPMFKNTKPLKSKGKLLSCSFLSAFNHMNSNMPSHQNIRALSYSNSKICCSKDLNTN